MMGKKKKEEEGERTVTSPNLISHHRIHRQLLLRVHRLDPQQQKRPKMPSKVQPLDPRQH